MYLKRNSQYPILGGFVCPQQRRMKALLAQEAYRMDRMAPGAGTCMEGELRILFSAFS